MNSYLGTLDKIQLCEKYAKLQLRFPIHHILYNLLFNVLILACDQRLVSTSSPSSKNGTFHAPVFLNPDKVIQQCTFTFEALANERVKLEFEDFDLDGTPPE